MTVRAAVRGAARARGRATSSRWPPAPPRTPRCSRWPTRWSRTTDAILAANAEDVAAARDAGTAGGAASTGCASTPARVRRRWPTGCATWPALPDPVGEVVRGSTLANGLELRQVRVPFGVVGIIYEARPNVTADAAGICLKSGNAVLLRGSSSAPRSNTAIVGGAARGRGRSRAARPTPCSWCRGRATSRRRS